MRIISGSHKGKKISPPKNLPVRPTTDFAKESLFNILNNSFEFSELSVLDLFAGTGNISLEFASRGARKIVAVDENYNCISFIKTLAGQLDFVNLYTIRTDAFKYIERCVEKFDIIFADPPYDIENIEWVPEIVFKNELLAEGGWLIVEHLKGRSPGFSELLYDQRRYGHVNFSIYAKKLAD